MKRYLLLILLVKIPAIVFCQFEWIINFEDSTMFDRIVVDTLENPSNIWQIGQPSKENFNSAYSGPNAMITDTLNSYPINDTSSFIIKHYRAGSWGVSNYELTLQFWFKFDSDSINDYGTVEASFDNGLTWINLLIEDSIHYLNWIEQKPVLTGKSNEWQHFALDLVHLSYEYVYNDTTLFYRFTFISDSIQTNKDGWMLDNFKFTDYWEGINKIEDDHLISVFPNPVNESFKINRTQNGNNQTIRITSLQGRLIYEDIDFNELFIDTKLFESGCYILKYTNVDYYSIKKIIISH